MSSMDASYQVAIAAVSGPRLSLMVASEGRAIPRARRFPFLVVCEAYQVQAGLAARLPDGWRLPGRVDVDARTRGHAYGQVLGRYRLDRGWGDDEREDEFVDDALIASVAVRDEADGRHAVVELEVRDAALLTHLIPGARWRLGWW